MKAALNTLRGGMDAPRKTAFPVPLSLVEHVLGLFGYKLVFSGNPTATRLHFHRDPHGVAEKVSKYLTSSNPPEEVMIKKPDFIADGSGEERVYDRDYVVDLLNKINGQVGGDAGHDLLLLLCETKKPH